MTRKPASSRRTEIRLIVFGLLFVAAAAVYLWNKKDSANALVEALHRFNSFSVALVFVAAFCQLFSSMFRTWLFLPVPRAINFIQVLYPVAVGQVANTFLPARAGDVLKVFLMNRLSKNGALPAMTAAGVIVADKIVDFIGFFSILLLAGGYQVMGVKMPAISPGGFAGVGATGVILLLTLRWLLKSHWHKIQSWYKNFMLGLATVASPTRLGGGILAGLCAWALEIIAFQGLAASQGVVLSPGQAIFILCLVFASIIVPISFANVGTFEASLTAGLVYLGVPLPTAVAIATVHHGMQLVGTLVWGTLAAIARQAGWSNLKSVAPIRQTLEQAGQTQTRSGK